jgi:hypothetical protein
MARRAREIAGEESAQGPPGRREYPAPLYQQRPTPLDGGTAIPHDEYDLNVLASRSISKDAGTPIGYTDDVCRSCLIPRAAL